MRGSGTPGHARGDIHREPLHAWCALPLRSFLRSGRAQPRHSVVRQPPGGNLLDLIPIQPNCLMIRATRRAFAVLMGKSSNVRIAVVLMLIILAGKARSSTRRQGSSWASSISARARCSLSISAMNASRGRCSRGWSATGLLLKHRVKIGKRATNCARRELVCRGRARWRCGAVVHPWRRGQGGEIHAAPEPALTIGRGRQRQVQKSDPIFLLRALRAFEGYFP